MPNKQSHSIIDFIIAITDLILAPNGNEASPYDVNFANHYDALYNLEENSENIDIDNIQKITQDKKTKTLTVDLKNCTISKAQAENFKNYCDTNNIDCDIQRGQVKHITINKNTKGVLEERSWNNQQQIK